MQVNIIMLSTRAKFLNRYNNTVAYCICLMNFNPLTNQLHFTKHDKNYILIQHITAKLKQSIINAKNSITMTD
jgi:hypothetical protein